MRRKYIILCVLLTSFIGIKAQRIDFDLSGRKTTEVTAPDFESWQIEETTFGKDITKSFGDIVVSIKSSTTLFSLRSGWYKAGITKDRLVNDGIHHDKSPQTTTDIILTVTGLHLGEHTLQAYHNNPDGICNGDISVSVNGKTVASGIKPSVRAVDKAHSAKSYIHFTGSSAVITYSSATDFYINSLEFDVPDAGDMAANPIPFDLDNHAKTNGDNISLKWSVAENGSDSQVLYFGEDSKSVDNGQCRIEKLSAKDSVFDIEGVNPLKKYYWRIDGIRNDKVCKGSVWMFQPRRLAFPGAEGYGKWAIGGRGGLVYHVTKLSDDGSEGTFRYGVLNVKGPRTIVFDVSGVITLTSRLTVSDSFVTIAGQTASGNGILFWNKPLGVASDGITRFIRLRLGGGDSWSGKGANENTSDGMGMAGNNNAIMDHCSIGWAIDEGFSSRNARNITLQHTLISEELNYAGHSHYVENGNRYVEHGYAATIGGGCPDGVGSYHHNLLAHNNGRNWSMSGGLLDGAYAGHHDMFNNVAYNWGSRTTDGGTHEGQFVNNYYKMGPSSIEKFLITADLEGTGKGTQSYFVSGNIRENTNGTLTVDQKNLRRQRTKNGQVVDWTVFRDKPFFESQAMIESAEAAYKNVLSDVGCNEPQLDKHDERMIRETLEGTSSTVGFYTHKKGLIDRESDSEGFNGLGILSETRPNDWDTDNDGMPDWWENAYGTDPNKADNNEDKDGDYYTNLEEYLNWMSCPHFHLEKGKVKINLNCYFSGYNKPSFSVNKVSDGASATIKDGIMTVKKGSAPTLFSVSVTASEGGVKLTRTFNSVDF
nr:hypothetical protein [Prevotella sp.]